MNKVEEVYNTWLGAKKSENTRKKYRNAVNLFCTMMFDKEAKDIDEDDLKNLK